MSKEEKTLPIVIVGHVDHGKSTLIGRLLYDTGSLPDEKLTEIRLASQSAGREMEFSFVMDNLEEERQRGITIDIAQTFFNTEKRSYVIIDAPGHKEFLKNMITGSSQAVAALLLIDAVEGVREQTKRHCFILGMLGIKQIVVLINKMDMVNYSRERFDALSTEITELFSQLITRPISHPPTSQLSYSSNSLSYIIPISARYGFNVATRDDRLKWFNGPTVLEALDSFETVEIEGKPLRFPVQDVYPINGKRVIVGRIEAGQIKRGDGLRILPEGETASVISIEKFQEEGIAMARTGECVGLCLDKPAVRGDILVSHTKTPPLVTQSIHASIFWMSDKPYHKGEAITFKCATQEVEGKIGNIYRRFDPATIKVVEKDAQEVGPAEIAEVEILLEKQIVVDSFSEIPEMGRFVLEKGGHPVAGGIIP